MDPCKKLVLGELADTLLVLGPSILRAGEQALTTIAVFGDSELAVTKAVRQMSHYIWVSTEGKSKIVSAYLLKWCDQVPAQPEAAMKAIKAKMAEIQSLMDSAEARKAKMRKREIAKALLDSNKNFHRIPGLYK